MSVHRPHSAVRWANLEARTYNCMMFWCWDTLSHIEPRFVILPYVESIVPLYQLASNYCTPSMQCTNGYIARDTWGASLIVAEVVILMTFPNQMDVFYDKLNLLLCAYKMPVLGRKTRLCSRIRMDASVRRNKRPDVDWHSCGTLLYGILVRLFWDTFCRRPRPPKVMLNTRLRLRPRIKLRALQNARGFLPKWRVKPSKRSFRTRFCALENPVA